MTKNLFTEFHNDQEGPGIRVPNKHPSITSFPYKIAIIGEAPGENEVRQGIPFVGASGYLLNSQLSRAGVARDACFVGNICQYRPPNNMIESFSLDGDEIAQGLADLSLGLSKFSPNVCLLLGKTTLWIAKGEKSVENWRGFVFVSDRNPFSGYKCIATYHPAACLRNYRWTPYLFFDIKKALRHAMSPDFNPPQRNLLTNISATEILHFLSKIKLQKPLISVDIEGGINSMSCLSIATSPSFSFIIPFTKRAGGCYWTNVDDEIQIWKALADVLEDPQIPKVLQNALYDTFVLQYSYNICIRNVHDDTMLKHWERFCEFDKSLTFQASLYTDEPFYKMDRKTDDEETFFRYCCRDSATTYEINELLEKWMKPSEKEHYRFNIVLLQPLRYMERRGLKYNTTLAKERLKQTQQYIYELQGELDIVSGRSTPLSQDRQHNIHVVQSIMCHKRDPNLPKVAFEQAYQEIIALLNKDDLSVADIGFIDIACGMSMNIRSLVFKEFLYDKLSLPKQYKTAVDKFGAKTQVLTTNYESLLRLQKVSPHKAVNLALHIGVLRTRAQILGISADKDGRVRCGYNIVGTETGRLTSYTSPTGSGYNLQTIPAEDVLKPPGHPLRRGMRDLFVADDGFYMFQCDLSGADGWTVAAHLAALGDRTMLDDYKIGIKPAKVLCYLLRHGSDSLSGKSRDDIYQLTKEVKKEDWDYFACKIGQHGSCYLMGPIKLADQIFIQSEGKVNITTKEARNLQQLFFIRYRVKLWHDALSRSLARNPEIVAASGHRRHFFGRSTEILGEALAHEPQANTTYATNLALYRLWTDSTNRVSSRLVGETTLRVEPLLHCHDAIVGQFRVEDTSWAVGKIKSWFDNQITIAGVPIVIPFEGMYGENWGNLDKGTI